MDRDPNFDGKNSHARINLDTHKYFNCSSLRGNLVAHAVGRIVPVVDFAFNWPCSRIARVLRNRAWISVCKGNGAKERIERERRKKRKKHATISHGESAKSEERGKEREGKKSESGEKRA